MATYSTNVVKWSSILTFIFGTYCHTVETREEWNRSSTFPWWQSLKIIIQKMIIQNTKKKNCYFCCWRFLDFCITNLTRIHFLNYQSLSGIPTNFWRNLFRHWFDVGTPIVKKKQLILKTHQTRVKSEWLFVV